MAGRVIDPVTMKLYAMGDVSFGDQPLCYGFGVLSKVISDGYENLFAAVSGLWNEDDIVFANLETVIDLESPDWTGAFENRINRGLIQAATALHRAGINLVSLSNNHVLDHGTAAIEATAHVLDRCGVTHVGSQFRRHWVVEREGKKVGFLAWSLIPDRDLSNSQPGGIYNLAKCHADILSDVDKLRANVDRLVLSLHWGNEFVTAPSPSQVGLARLLVERGVDVLIGHHPHVLQPVERYRGGLILYSLGNFVFDYWIDNCNLTAVVEIDLLDSMEYTIHPIRIGRDFAPGPAVNQKDIARIKASLEGASVGSQSEYLRQVHKQRQVYRLSAVAHVLRNLGRFLRRRSSGFWRWFFERMFFVVRISRRERTDPEIVYRNDR